MKEVQDEDEVSKMSVQGYTSFNAVVIAPGRQEKVYYYLFPSGDVAVNTHP